MNKVVAKIWHSKYVQFFVPDKLYLSLYFRKRFGYNMNWKEPKTFNEKIQWLKLYSDTTQWTYLSDKIQVREYIKEKGLEDILIPIYGIWKNPNDIQFDVLPDSYVLKSNHGSGTVIVVKNNRNLDKKTAVFKMKNWLKMKYGAFSAELHYLGITPLIYAEAFLNDDVELSSSVIDYKIFCQNGVPSCIWVCRNRTPESVDVSTYDVSWKLHPEWAGDSSHYHKSEISMAKPKNFERMLDIAKILSEDFPQVRVDLYNIGGKIYFGELTFTSCSGTMDIFSKDYLIEMGNKVKLPGFTTSKIER